MRLLCGWLLFPAVAIAAEVPPPTGESIVAADAKLEKLFTRTAAIKGGLTEGPCCAPDGRIYFSDIPIGTDKGMILCFDPKTGKTTVFADDSKKSNGLKIDPKGRLVACEGADHGGRGVARYDLASGTRTVIADRFQNKRFNAPNDLTIDRQGRIYFSDPKYLGPEERELEYRAVYRINEDGSVIEVTHDVEKPNGVCLSPDEKTLYVADHNNGSDRLDVPTATPAKRGAMKLYAFPLNAAGLVAGPKRTLIDFGDQPGIDGMCADREGNLYLACRSLKRPGVMVVDPTGKELAFIPTGPVQPDATMPVGLPSNVCFGRGAESRTLYITIDVGLYRIPVKKEGHHLPLMK